MPAIVIGAAASAGFGALAGGTFLGFAAASWEAIGLRFVVGLALGGLSQALSPKPKKQTPLNAAVSNNTVTARAPDFARRHVYGQTRVTSCYAYVGTTDNNQYLHQVIVLCNGPISSIDEVWADDYVIPNDWLDSAGNVTQGRYAGHMRIKKYLGFDSQVADADLISEISELDSNFRLRGIAYLYVRMLKNQDVFPTGVPNFSAVVKGRAVNDPRTGFSAFSTNIALFINDFLSNTTFGFAAPSADINADSFSTEANISDEIVDTSDAIKAGVIAVDTSTNILTLSGSMLPFQLGDRVEASSLAGSPSGLPHGLIEGHDYYIIPYQFGTNPRVQLATSLDNAMAGTAVDITSAGSVDANDASKVTLTRTGEPRYHGGGVVDTAQTLGDTLTSLLASCAGRAVNIGGQWRLLVGAWRAPGISIGIGDIAGPVTVPTKISMASRANLIKGQFVSSINNWQAADYPPVISDTYIAQDNGYTYQETLNLPFTNRAAAAQRISKIEMLRNRQEIVVNTTCKLAVLQQQPGDTLEATVARYGWSSKAFEITTMGLRFGSDGNQSLLVDVALRETDSSVYDWSTDEESPVDPAPNSTLPDPFTVDAPQDVSYDTRVVTTSGGDTIYNLVLNWMQSDDGFVLNDGQAELQFKLSADSIWRPSFFVDGSLTFADFPSGSINTEYDLRVRFVNRLGRHSNWQTILNAVIGHSGGVTFTIDYGSVADAVGTTNNWGSVADPVGTSNDWGSVV